MISKAELSIAFNQFGTTQKVIKKEIYQPVFAVFKDAINDPEKLKTAIKNAIKKTLDPENKLDLQYDAIEKEDLDIDNNPNQKYWVENWIKAIYSYQQKKQQEELTINVVGYLLPDDLTNEPLGNDTRNNIDSKFKSEDSSPPGGEEHDKPDDPPVDGQ